MFKVTLPCLRKNSPLPIINCMLHTCWFWSGIKMIVGVIRVVRTNGLGVQTTIIVAAKNMSCDGCAHLMSKLWLAAQSCSPQAWDGWDVSSNTVGIEPTIDLSEGPSDWSVWKKVRSDGWLVPKRSSYNQRLWQWSLMNKSMAAPPSSADWGLPGRLCLSRHRHGTSHAMLSPYWSVILTCDSMRSIIAGDQLPTRSEGQHFNMQISVRGTP